MRVGVEDSCDFLDEYLRMQKKAKQTHLFSRQSFNSQQVWSQHLARERQQ